MQNDHIIKTNASRPIAAAKEKANALLGKTEEIEKCFQKAKEKVVTMPQHEYEEWLAHLVVTHIKPGFDKISFNLRDKNRLSLMRFIVLLNTKAKGLGEAMPLLNIARDTVDTEAGFVLKNGDSEIDCTIEFLIEQAKQEVLKKQPDPLPEL